MAIASTEDEESPAETGETAEAVTVETEHEYSEEEYEDDNEEESFYEPSEEEDLPCQGVEVEYDVDDNGIMFSCIGVCEDDSVDDKYLPSGFSIVSEIPFGDYEDCGTQFSSAVMSIASPKKSKKELQALREEKLAEASLYLCAGTYKTQCLTDEEFYDSADDFEDVPGVIMDEDELQDSLDNELMPAGNPKPS